VLIGHLLCGAPRALHSFPTRRSSDLETADVVVQEGDISWYVAPYGGKWLSWDDPDMRPHVMVHDSYDDAVLHQVQGAVEKGCEEDRKSTRLNSSHVKISYAVFCLKKK